MTDLVSQRFVLCLEPDVLPHRAHLSNVTPFPSMRMLPTRPSGATWARSAHRTVRSCSDYRFPTEASGRPLSRYALDVPHVVVITVADAEAACASVD